MFTISVYGLRFLTPLTIGTWDPLHISLLNFPHW